METVRGMGSKILDSTLFTSNSGSSSFFFRKDVILAHTENIVLVSSASFDGQDNLKELQPFLKIVRLNDSQLPPNVLDEIVTDTSQPVKKGDLR